LTIACIFFDICYIAFKENKSDAMTESNSVECVPKSIVRYIKENPHMAVSVALFCGGGLALQRDVTSLAGSLFGAGGALLGAWITELTKRRSESLFGKSGMGVSSGEISAHGDEDHGL
jgi:hypothetical protein